MDLSDESLLCQTLWQYFPADCDLISEEHTDDCDAPAPAPLEFPKRVTVTEVL